MAAELKQALPDADVSLVESAGGVFEVAVNGVSVFSKKSLGRHAQPGEVLSAIRASR